MSGNSDPIDRLVRRAGAVHDDDLARSWSHSRAEQALFEEITMRTTQERAERPVPMTALRAVRRRGPVLVAASAVVAGSLGLFTVLSAGPAADPAAADVLLAAGSVAAAGSGPEVLDDGEYWYTSTQLLLPGEGGSGAVVTGVPLCEEWVAADGSGRLSCTADSSEPRTADFTDDFPAASADLEAELEADPEGDPEGEPIYRPDTWSDDATYQDLLALPTDPDALLAHFESKAEEQATGGEFGSSREYLMFTGVAQVLRQPAPPALRAALFEVASRIPGVELVGQVTDGLGRSGVAVAMVEGGDRFEVVIDPTTSALLTERFTLPTGLEGTDGPGGMAEEVVVSSGIVDSLTERP